jgi:hypothetical protein
VMTRPGAFSDPDHRKSFFAIDVRRNTILSSEDAHVENLTDWKPLDSRRAQPFRARGVVGHCAGETLMSDPRHR